MLPKKRLVKAPAERVAVKATILVVPKKTTVKTPAVQKTTRTVVSSTKVKSRVKTEDPKVVKKTSIRTTRAKKVVPKKLKASKVESVTTREEVVLLEGTISKRLLEKKQAYDVWFREKAVSQFSNVAYVFGYFFIMVGLLSSIFIVSPNWSHHAKQSAALPCASNLECNSISTSTTPKVVYVTAPEVKPGQDLVVTVEISSVEEPVLVVTSPVLTPPLRLTPSSKEENVYTYQVPTSTMSPSAYRLRIEGVANKNVITSFVGPLITLDEIEEEALGNETGDFSSTTVPVSMTETIVDWEIAPHQLAMTEATSGGLSLVTFVTMNKFEDVLFYIRPDHATTEFLLGRAELQNDDWLYRLDQSKLPRGAYTIIAKGIDQKVVKAEAMITFNNRPVSTTDGEMTVSTSSTSLPIATEETATSLLKALSIENHAGTTSGLERNQNELSDTETQASSSDAAWSDMPESMSTILSVFALAKQSNNELLLRVSEGALEEAVLKSVAAFGIQDKVPSEIATFETNLRSELKKEQAIIALNSQNSNAFYPADTDQDGITDTEEDASEGMSSRLADTDDDGYLDGIEQIFGYNPTDYSPETVFRLSASPTEVPQTETVLGILSIQPLAIFETEGENPRIHLQVTGFGIPNSYVVLAIETGVTALVSVDQSGAFTHIIENDIADGTYTASVFYVANSGAYVAASRPFSFTKDAQDANYIKTATPVPVLGASLVAANPKTLNLPGSLGVIALGLLLLYVSRSMRYHVVMTEKAKVVRV